MEDTVFSEGKDDAAPRTASLMLSDRKRFRKLTMTDCKAISSLDFVESVEFVREIPNTSSTLEVSKITE